MQSVPSTDNGGSSSPLARRQTVTQSAAGWEGGREGGNDGGREQAKDNKLRLDVDLKKQKDEPRSAPRKQTPGFVSASINILPLFSLPFSLPTLSSPSVSHPSYPSRSCSPSPRWPAAASSCRLCLPAVRSRILSHFLSPSLSLLPFWRCNHPAHSLLTEYNTHSTLRTCALCSTIRLGFIVTGKEKK